MSKFLLQCCTEEEKKVMAFGNDMRVMRWQNFTLTITLRMKLWASGSIEVFSYMPQAWHHFRPTQMPLCCLNKLHMQQPEKNDKTPDKEVNNSNVTDIGKLIFCNAILKLTFQVFADIRRQHMIQIETSDSLCCHRFSLKKSFQHKSRHNICDLSGEMSAKEFIHVNECSQSDVGLPTSGKENTGKPWFFIGK